MTREEETSNFLGVPVNDIEYPYDDDAAECYECGGEGWITDDCFEDSCCCGHPECDHGFAPCPVCNPGGRE